MPTHQRLASIRSVALAPVVTSASTLEPSTFERITRIPSRSDQYILPLGGSTRICLGVYVPPAALPAAPVAPEPAALPPEPARLPPAPVASPPAPGLPAVPAAPLVPASPGVPLAPEAPEPAVPVVPDEPPVPAPPPAAAPPPQPAASRQVPEAKTNAMVARRVWLMV